MRILHLVHQYPPEHVGGTERYTQSLARELARRGHQVTVFYRRSATGSGQETWLEGDVRVHVAWSGPLGPATRFLSTFGNAFITDTFRQVLDQVQPHLVHLQHLMGLPATLFRLLKQRGIPFILTLHDYWWICANAQLLTNYAQRVCNGPRAYLNCTRCALARIGRPWLWPAFPILAGLLAWRNRVLRRVLMGAHWLVAPTEFVRRWYIAQGALAERVVVIPHGIDFPDPVPGTRSNPNKPVRFVYIGGLSWQKGVHVLVEALNEVHGAAELWIAGDESFDPAYVAYLRERASPNVQFVGRLSRQEVWRTLAQADVVVVPSLWYETFSLVVHEAFAARVPVVASRLGALADRVQDGVDGLLVPPGDVKAWRAALQRLVDEPDLLERLRASIRPPMTLKEHVDQLETLYTQAVDSHHRAC